MPQTKMWIAGYGNQTITHDAFADGALDNHHFTDRAFQMAKGKIVPRATKALPQTTAEALYTITGGLVLLQFIIGYVTTLVGAVANATKLKVNPSGAGATTDICATVEWNAAAVDSIFTITGTFANAMVKTVNLPISGLQASPVIVPPGTIELDCAGSDGGTGRVKWIACYIPLEEGASMVAA